MEVNPVPLLKYGALYEIVLNCISACPIANAPAVIPAEAGIQVIIRFWTPAFAGVTILVYVNDLCK
jgi:hypothetical protein